jgi:hypothetical protein
MWNSIKHMSNQELIDARDSVEATKKMEEDETREFPYSYDHNRNRRNNIKLSELKTEISERARKEGVKIDNRYSGEPM